MTDGPSRTSTVASDQDVVRVRQLVRTVGRGRQALARRPDQAGDRRERAGPQHPGLRRRRHGRGRAAWRTAGGPGVRIVFADEGPGIADLDLALTDGYTTGGGLGLGLSGARRLVDEFDIDTAVGAGYEHHRDQVVPMSEHGRRQRRYPTAPRRGVWFRVEEASAACGVRRAAERLAVELGMPERRIADLAIVAAELASNLVKHADEGVAAGARRSATASQAGVEIIAIDSGPGMADVVRRVGDGHSTAGTLGIGLGAIAPPGELVRRCIPCPGKGTVLAVQVWPSAAPEPVWAAGLTRPLTGEPVSGDAFARARAWTAGARCMVCDGLGHGPLAATAAAGGGTRDSPTRRPLRPLRSWRSCTAR